VILGFDPRYQFIHEEDMANCLEHAVKHDVDGVFNCAADGVLVLSEVLDLLGKQLVPALPPWGTGLASAALKRAGVPFSPEMLRQLRFGRALDNRRFKATGFRYRYTTREAVLKLREHQRLAPLLRTTGEGYRYERQLEEFLRYSPSVRAANAAPKPPQNVPKRPRRPAAPRKAAAGAPPTPDYADLQAEEVIAMLADLERGDLERLREHEAAHDARPSVLQAIDSLLARQGAPA
jgi:UDP-glucose 4-epimerase